MMHLQTSSSFAVCDGICDGISSWPSLLNCFIFRFLREKCEIKKVIYLLHGAGSRRENKENFFTSRFYSTDFDFAKYWCFTALHSGIACTMTLGALWKAWLWWPVLKRDFHCRIKQLYICISVFSRICVELTLLFPRH